MPNDRAYLTLPNLYMRMASTSGSKHLPQADRETSLHLSSFEWGNACHVESFMINSANKSKMNTSHQSLYSTDNEVGYSKQRKRLSTFRNGAASKSHQKQQTYVLNEDTLNARSRCPPPS
jgi:hypothetical protein